MVCGDFMFWFVGLMLGYLFVLVMLVMVLCFLLVFS